MSAIMAEVISINSETTIMDPRAIKNIRMLFKSIQNVVSDVARTEINEGPFDLDTETLERRRFEIVARQKEILPDIPNFSNHKGENAVKNEAMRQLRSEINELTEFKRKQDSLISHWKEISAKNEETSKYLEEVFEGMEDCANEETHLIRSKQKFAEAKRQLNYVLEKFLPDHREDILYVLSALENTDNDSEDTWTELKEITVEVLNVLLQCKIIIQHPEKWDLFKMAPFFEKTDEP